MVWWSRTEFPAAFSFPEIGCSRCESCTYVPVRTLSTTAGSRLTKTSRHVVSCASFREEGVERLLHRWYCHANSFLITRRVIRRDRIARARWFKVNLHVKVLRLRTHSVERLGRHPLAVLMHMPSNLGRRTLIHTVVVDDVVDLGTDNNCGFALHSESTTEVSDDATCVRCP